MFATWLFLSALVVLIFTLTNHFFYGLIGGAAFFALYFFFTWLFVRLGENGKWFGIVNTMKVVFVEKYGKLHKIYLNPTSDLLRETEDWKNKKEGKRESGESEESDKDPEKEKIYEVVIVKGSGLFWLGPPWIYKIRAFPWSVHDKKRYLEEGETDDPEKKIPHSLFMGDYTLRLKSRWQGPDKKALSSGYDEHGVPNYETADPVQVASALTLIFRIKDYEKAGYRLQYPKDTMQDMILGEWREVLGSHKFFSEILSDLDQEGKEEGGEKTAGKRKSMSNLDDMDIEKLLGKYKPEIIQVAAKYLAVQLGIAKWNDDKERGQITYIEPENYTEGTVAYKLWDVYGIQLIRVVVTDLEEISGSGKDGTVREKLESLLRELTDRRTTLIKADAEARASAIEALGEERKIKAKIRAFEVDPEKKRVKLDEYDPSPEAVRAYLQERGLAVLEKLPKEGRSLFFQGMPGSDSLAKVFSQAGEVLDRESLGKGKKNGASSEGGKE